MGVGRQTMPGVLAAYGVLDNTDWGCFHRAVGTKKIVVRLMHNSLGGLGRSIIYIRCI